MKGKQGVVCPVCGSAVVTRYDSHFECDGCGRQWTQIEKQQKKR